MMHMHHIPSTTPCLCTALRKASRAVTRDYDQHLAGSGLSTPQFALLRHIERGGEMALSALAERLVMDRTTLYRSLGPLEAAGWVETLPALRGHVRHVRLTAAGCERIAQALEGWETCQATMRARLGEDDWATLVALTGRVVALSGDVAEMAA